MPFASMVGTARCAVRESVGKRLIAGRVDAAARRPCQLTIHEIRIIRG